MGNRKVFTILICALFLLLPNRAQSKLGLKVPDNYSTFWNKGGNGRSGRMSLSNDSPALLESNGKMIQDELEVYPGLNRVKFVKMFGKSRYGWPVTLGVDDFVQLSTDMDRGKLWFDRDAVRENKMDRKKDGGLSINIPVKIPKALRSFIGEGSRVKVSGRRKISFSGRSEWTEGQIVTARSRPSKFPSLNMKQDSRFTVEGIIGERIHVQVEQDSRGRTDNAIKLRYDGIEDGIIQEIEAGNTTLSLPGTQFVGFSAQSKGLFGIRAKSKVGSVDITTIVSQEKSSGKKKTFRGGAQQNKPRRIKDFQYVRNKYFFLDLLYKDRFRDKEYKSQDSVVDLRVFVDDQNQQNDAEDRAIDGLAYFDLNNREETATNFHRGKFHEIDPNDYFLDPRLGYIILNRPVRDYHVVAVTYETNRGDSFGDVDRPATVGEELTLKLIKAKNQRPFPGQETTWELEWKNVYNLGGRRINLEGFDLRIFKDLPGDDPDDSQNGVPYIKILGLDLKDRDNNAQSDNLVDLGEIQIGNFRFVPIDLERGELVFPDLQPFAPLNSDWARDNGLDIPPLEETIPQIYESQDRIVRQNASRYFIEVEVQDRQSSRVSISSFGILEGSEEVILNGRRLQRRTDYNIDYFSGDITFLTDEALSPTAEVVVNFEDSPLFAFAAQQKTLIGTRAEYKFMGRSSLGSTFLYNNERSIDKRVRVGQEPARTIIWDTDLRLRFEPKLMTSFVNAIPFVKSSQSSKLDISAEFAQSLPNPNTLGQAFIDDFEGSSRKTSFGIFRSVWTQASPPVDDPQQIEDFKSNQGRLIWYNPFDRIDTREIWPNKEVSSRENKTDVLVLDFDPEGKATYQDAASGPIEERWGGVMRALPSGGNDFSRSKFIEVWVKGDDGTLNIDLGDISEDVILNKILDTEDRDISGIRNNVLDIDEDVGIDGLADEDEPGYVPVSNPDPNGDNWHYDSDRDSRDNYEQINGTEDSKHDSDRGLIPDTEDINNNSFLDSRNAYYQYSIPLYTDNTADPTSYLVEGTYSNGWRLFRVPLWDSPQIRSQNEAKPDSTRIEYVRLWVTGVDSRTEISIASIEIAGNEWLESQGLLGDQKLDVSIKSTDQNKDYISPVEKESRQVDRTSGVREREQSLVLKFENIAPGQEVSANKVLFRKESYTEYGRLKMFVNGQGDSFLPDTSTVELFIRFGADTTNYYEYRTKVFSGEVWDKRNEIDIDLELMSGLKGDLLDAQAAARADSQHVPTYIDTTVDGKVHRVRGNPALSNIKLLTVGLINRGTEDITGEVWVDELRLDDVRREKGTAARLQINAGFADFMDISTSLSWQEGNFRTLRSERGSGSTRRNINFRGDANLDRFLPNNWGVSLPLRVSWNNSLSLPRLKPGSDVVLRNEEKMDERTERTRKNINISFRKKESKNPFIKYTIDRASATFNSTIEDGISPRDSTLNESLSGSFKYDLSPRSDSGIKLLGWTSAFLPDFFSESKFRYFPSSFSYSNKTNKNKRFRSTVDQNRQNRRETKDDNFIMVEDYRAKFNPFKSLSSDYSLNRKKDLERNLDIGKFKFGDEIGRSQNGHVDLKLDLIKWLSQYYSYNARYKENNDPKTRRGGQSGRDINNENSISGKFTLQLPSFFKAIGNIKKKSKDKGKGTLSKEEDKGKGTLSKEEDKKGKVSPASIERTSAGNGTSLLDLIAGLGEKLSPVSGSYTRKRSFRKFGLKDRPSLSYQLGFTEDPKVESANLSGVSQSDSKTISDRINANSGVKLFSGISVKTDYLYDRSVSDIANREPRHTKKVTFPSLSSRWNGLAKMPLLKRVAKSSNLDFKYKRVNSWNGDGGLDIDKLRGKTATSDFSPLFAWTTRWKNKLRTTLKSTNSRSFRTDFTGGRERGSTVTTKNSSDFSLDYSISTSRGIPFFGKKVKLKSDVDMTLKFTKSRTKEENKAPSSKVSIPRRDQNSWTLVFNSSYKFSRKLTGGSKIEVGNTFNNISKTTRKIRELGFWAEIRFD